jgi:HAMP domain-containing protein
VVLPEAIAFAAAFLFIARLNANAARRLQRKIEELDEAGREG